MAKTYPQLKVVMPDKKPKGGERTEAPKALNFLKASVRVVVEHAIAVVKRLKVITHAYRNRTHQRTDQFNMLTITEGAQKKNQYPHRAGRKLRYGVADRRPGPVSAQGRF